MASRIRTGDSSVVLTGKDRGKSGKVRQILPKEGRVIVEGVNIVKRHTKARGPGQPGGIIEKEATIHISNLAHIDPASQKPTRVGYKFLDDGRKVRVARRSGEVLDA